MLNGTNVYGRTVCASERRVLTINQLADAQTVQCGSNKVKRAEKRCAKSFRFYNITQNQAKWHINYLVT